MNFLLFITVPLYQFGRTCVKLLYMNVYLYCTRYLYLFLSGIVALFPTKTLLLLFIFKNSPSTNEKLVLFQHLILHDKTWTNLYQ